jgi:hypothetical protein
MMPIRSYILYEESKTEVFQAKQKWTKLCFFFKLYEESKKEMFFQIEKFSDK